MTGLRQEPDSVEVPTRTTGARSRRARRGSHLACISLSLGFLLIAVAVLFACATLGRPRAKAFFEWAGFTVLQTPDSDTYVASGSELGLSVFIDPALIALTWRSPVGSAAPVDRKVEFAGFRYRRSAVVTGTPPTVGSSLGARKWSLVLLCLAGAIVSCIPLPLRRRPKPFPAEASTNA